jgi:hypothetical protein
MSGTMTQREHCEHQAQEWETTAEIAAAAVRVSPDLAASDSEREHQAGRIRAACLGIAEEWRARARRGAR